MERNGGCACGAIRFKVMAPFLGVGACHCTDCQKASGGGPNYVALAPKGALVVTKGEARLFHCTGDSGGDVARAFCPDCGTPLWGLPHHAPFATVKVGAFDDWADLAPQMHIYVDSAPPWHERGNGQPTFAKMPPMEVG